MESKCTLHFFIIDEFSNYLILKLALHPENTE